MYAKVHLSRHIQEKQKHILFFEGQDRGQVRDPKSNKVQYISGH